MPNDEKSSSTEKSASTYAINDRVLCYHCGMLYEAKILDVADDKGVPKYFVHYQGWNNRWDEWVLDDRLLVHNDENLKKQQELAAKVSGSSKSGGGRGRPPPGGGDSSTPKLGKTPSAGGKGKASAGSSGPSTPFDGSSSKGADSAGGGLELESRASTPSVDGGASVASSSTTSAAQSGSSKRKANAKQKNGSTVDSITSTVKRERSDDLSETPTAGEPKRKRGRQQAATAQVAAVLPPPGAPAAVVLANGVCPEFGVESFHQFWGRQEVPIKIPTDLKDIIVDDWDLITRQAKVVKLPAPKTVTEILDDYFKEKQNQRGVTSAKLDQIKEVASGIREYFNVLLGTQLLYKFERPQYNDILTQHQQSHENETGNTTSGGSPSSKQPVPLCSIYGLPHLLRLFVRMGHMLAYTDLDQKAIDIVLSWIQEFLKYLSKNKANFFHLDDYETAPPEYQRKAYAN